MAIYQMLAWPQRIGYVLNALLIGAGWLLSLALLMEWPPVSWSRAVIGLQALAVLLALLLSFWSLAPRLVIYPLILAATMYLWDHTLPPPNLPNGALRALIPRLILLGVFVDGLVLTRREHQTRLRQIQIRNGYLTLDDAALLCRISVDDLRAWLAQAGRTTKIGEDGGEQVALADLDELT